MNSEQSSEQRVKDKLKTKRDISGVSYNILLKKFFIDGFLERLSQSAYVSNFVWKGGFVLSIITGVQHRTTVDLDTMLTGVSVSVPTLTRIINDIIDSERLSYIRYELVDIKPIHEEKAYQGLRIRLKGRLGQMQDNFHLDVATGERLEPSAIKLSYTPTIGDKAIPIYAYRPERILAEKLQTILERSIANTRMKDFYDIYAIPKYTNISHDVLLNAFKVVMTERNTLNIWNTYEFVLTEIRNDKGMHKLWQSYADEQTFIHELTLDQTLDVAYDFFRQLSK
ncbi:abortive infection protein [Lactiplantibacillus plantarum EGD-AQ4]|nr:abortive infection protein [Lactiplantibacillus plantarum EGD-AQ4]